jgi:hypothetical protein
MVDRVVLILLSTDGGAEIITGRMSRAILNDGIVRHFVAKAMEMMRAPVDEHQSNATLNRTKVKSGQSG